VLSGPDDTLVEGRGPRLRRERLPDKSIASAELLAPVRAHLRISEVTEQLRADGLLDVVMGRASRRGVIETLRREVARATRERTPLAVLRLDITGTLKPGGRGSSFAPALTATDGSED